MVTHTTAPRMQCVGLETPGPAGDLRRLAARVLASRPDAPRGLCAFGAHEAKVEARRTVKVVAEGLVSM